MNFLVIAYDGKDDDAINRRMKVRENHLALAKKQHEDGVLICGGAILDDDGKMIGSAMMVDYPSLDDLNNWLKVEPYVIGDVWRDIEIKPCRVADFFIK